jgi:hypothetical protein
VIGQAQVVIGTEIEHTLPGRHGDTGPLGTVDDTFVLVQTVLSNLIELLMYLFL